MTGDILICKMRIRDVNLGLIGTFGENKDKEGKRMSYQALKNPNI